MDGHLNRRFALVQLEALETFRDELDEEIAFLKGIIERTNQDPSRIPAEGTHSADLRNAIVRILMADRPLHRQAILNFLQDGSDLYIGGTNPLRTLAAHLSHDPRFKPVGNGRWTLTEEPTVPNDPEDLVFHGAQLQSSGPATTEIKTTDGPVAIKRI